MDKPPVDCGSDRYGYVEATGPLGFPPPEEALIDSIVRDACQDCNPNIFMSYRPGAGNLGSEGDPPGDWWVQVAHDMACPTFARLEKEGKLGALYEDRTPVLEQWVIYWNPADYPDQYVVRRWEIGRGWMRPTNDVQAFDMLGEARMAVPDGKICLGPTAGDDPTIVEVWT